ncbi:MAG: hypothetical protein Q9227_002655 [Pyrenula ochraceoflavens]
MSLPTPRILPTHLHAFSPSTLPTSSTPTPVIRLLGTITSLRGDQATLSSCGSSVTCLLSRDSHLRLNGIYEVLGKVVNLEGGMGEGVKLLSATEWDESKVGEKGVDWRAWEAVVEATHRCKGIFYGGKEDE